MDYQHAHGVCLALEVVLNLQFWEREQISVRRQTKHLN